MTSERAAALRRTSSVAIPLLIFLTLVTWAFASPVGSSPDDDFHLPSIWCGLGERPGLCEAAEDPASRAVPAPLLTANCYAFKPDQSGDCWNPSASGLADTERVNTAPLYPPLYYGTMSVFASPDVQSSVIVIRIVNSALIVGLLTAVFWALPRRVRPALVVSAVVASVPLGLFVIASTNPTSWAFVSAATVWICVYGATQTTGRRQILLSSLALLGGLMGAGSRADAAIFAVFGIVLAVILGARLRRNLLIPGVAVALIVAASIAFYLGARQGGSVVTGLPNENPPLTIDQLAANLLNVPSLWIGAFGGWGLGWLDTLLPAVVSVLTFGVFCGAIFIGIRTVGIRRGVALSLAFMALWLVPFILLAQSRATVGSEVQPRYLLPLIVLTLGIATLTPDAVSQWRGPRLFVTGLALTVAMSISLHYNMRRYTTGAEDAALDPGARAEWWWTGVPSPLILWLTGSLAFAAALLLLYLVVRTAPDEPIASAADVPPRAAPADPPRYAAIPADTTSSDGPALAAQGTGSSGSDARSAHRSP